MVFAYRIVAGNRREEIGRHHARALVYQLIEGVLSVGARFPPNYHTGGIVHDLPIAVYAFTIAFHLQLLQISGEMLQILIVGKDGI